MPFEKPKGSYTLSFEAAQLKKKKRLSPDDYKKQQKMVEALYETSGYLAVGTDIKVILSRIAKTLLKALGAKYVNFWDFTPNKEALFISAAAGMQKQYIAHSRKSPIRVGTMFIGRAVATGQPWASSDVTKDPNIKSNWLTPIKKQNYHGLLCLPMMGKKGAVGGMCVYYKDIHQFNYFEMALATIATNQAATAVANADLFHDLLGERNKTLATIQSLKDGLIMYDLDERVVVFNPRAQELLWLKEGEVLGKKINEPLSRKSVYLQNLFNIRNLVQSDFETKEYTTEGPQKVILEITYVPVRSQYRKIGAMQILRDITRDKEVELLKAKFLAVASHQLRTPLSAIKWALDTLRRSTLTAEQKQIVDRTFNSNENLIALVRDLLDVSRIEEGRLGYKFKQGDLSRLVSKIYEDVKIQASARQIDIIYEKPENPLPPAVFDAGKIDIAIRNVVDNAIKYVLPGGSIKINLRPSLNNKILTLSVKDNGIGIPENDQKFIFVKFFRALNALKHNTEGSGLGLYIAKKIAEKHNADLFFESVENQGSEFVFQFPLEAERMPKIAIADEEFKNA
ncbi:GAF domain-containing protein [Patescibacteria group bacterium]|nr:GAF domain-containing protein [Patescibacteria group bacterium]